MINFSLISFFLLRIAFLSLPRHLNPASLGIIILIIVLASLVYFISLNITLIAIFIILVYIRGILILFSYFFSLIQNIKIFFIPLIFVILSLGGFNLLIFTLYSSEFLRKIVILKNFSFINSFLWILSDTKLIFFLVIILLLRILFVEKVIGLKQKPLRLK